MAARLTAVDTGFSGVFSLSQPVLGVLQEGQVVISSLTSDAHVKQVQNPSFPRSTSEVVLGVGEVGDEAITRESVLLITTKEEEVEEVPRLMASSNKASSSASSAGVIFSCSERRLPLTPALFNS